MNKIRIGDACEILNGYAFKSDKYVVNGIRVIRIANVQKGYIEDNTPAFYPNNSTGLGKYMLAEGDLLMSLTGNVGRVAILEKRFLPAALNQRVACLRLKTDTISKGYLFHILNSDFFEKQCIQSSKGVAQKNMSTEWLKDYEIPLYTKEEQTEIEKTLDKVHEILASRKSELQKLDDLIKARFVEMFGDPVSNSKGWQTKRFDSICENLDSKRKPITSSERQSGEYPYYGASGIVDYVADYIFDEDILLVSEDGANLLMRSTPIAFSVSGKVWVNNHAHVVRFNDMGLQKYIEVFFSMIDISDQITGSAQPKLNQAKLNAMLFPIPDKKLTDSFREFITQIDKSKVVVQKALDEAQLLFDSLMQKYFG